MRLVSVHDSEGPMCTVPVNLAERDVQRGLLFPTDNPHVYRLNDARVAALNAIAEQARRVRKFKKFA